MPDPKAPETKTPRKRGRAPVVPLAVKQAPAPAFVPPRAEPLVMPEMIAPPASVVAHVEAPVAPPPPEAAPATDASGEEAAPQPSEPEPARADAAVAEPVPAEAGVAQPAPEPEPATPVASSPVQTSNEGMIEMASTFQPAATAETAEKAKAVLGDFNNRAKATMEKSVKMGEEMTEMTKGNVEALVQSGRVAAKGVEQLAQDAAETAKKNFEAATATMKSFASVKSPTELFQLQSDAAKSYFDTAVADFSKFTEQLIKLAGDVAQPLSSRYSVAMDKVKTTAL